MYKNAGKTIMVLAQVCGLLYAIAGVFAWLYFLANGSSLIGWICLLVGALVCVSFCALYGFGQIVDDVNAMRKDTDKLAEAPGEELPEL